METLRRVLQLDQWRLVAAWSAELVDHTVGSPVTDSVTAAIKFGIHSDSPYLR